MKKNITFTFLALGGLLALSSCTEDKDQEVYVGDNFFTESQKIISEINALSYPVGFSDSDIEHPEYKNMDPEVYTDEKTTEDRGTKGYYGYVDLGLSVYWATSNLGSVSPVNKQSTIEEKLDEVESNMGIEPMEKPSFTNNADNTYPAIMTYEQYLKSLDINELYAAYNKYNNYCKQKTTAHDNTISFYNTEQYNNHQYLYANGEGYPWGGLSMWDFLGTSTAPLDIAGNVEYDVATYILGEGWSMPTKAQWQELIDKCTWEQHDRYYIVTGPSGKQIVLARGWYHTSEQTSDKKVYDLVLKDTKEFKTFGYRDRQNVRAVHAK